MPEHVFVSSSFEHQRCTLRVTRTFQAGSRAQYLFDAFYLYGKWLNYSSANGLDLKDGVAWLNFAKNTSFEGIVCVFN